MDEIILRIIEVLLAMCLMIVLFPVLITLFLYIEGWFVAQLVGGYICAGASCLGISLIPENIPLIFIILGWVGYVLQSGPAFIAEIQEILVNAYARFVGADEEDE